VFPGLAGLSSHVTSFDRSNFFNWSGPNLPWPTPPYYRPVLSSTVSPICNSRIRSEFWLQF